MRLKKYWTGLMVAAVLMSVPVAADETGHANAVDFSNYTDEEVVKLLDEIQEEIVNRQIEKTAVLEKGLYSGGKDIPAGSYIMTKNADTDDSGIVWLRAAEDQENEWPSKLYEFVGKEEEASFYITIDQGDTLSLPFRVSLTISGAVVFK